jgi:hypothetical protein
MCTILYRIISLYNANMLYAKSGLRSALLGRTLTACLKGTVSRNHSMARMARMASGLEPFSEIQREDLLTFGFTIDAEGTKATLIIDEIEFVVYRLPGIANLPLIITLPGGGVISGEWDSMLMVQYAAELRFQREDEAEMEASKALEAWEPGSGKPM